LDTRSHDLKKGVGLANRGRSARFWGVWRRGKRRWGASRKDRLKGLRGGDGSVTPLTRKRRDPTHLGTTPIKKSIGIYSRAGFWGGFGTSRYKSIIDESEDSQERLHSNPSSLWSRVREINRKGAKKLLKNQKRRGLLRQNSEG